ncbi:hypothetical protein D3C79_860020 [compost metagenome]
MPVERLQVQLHDGVAQRRRGAVDLRRGELAVIDDGAQARAADRLLGVPGDPAGQLAALHQDQLETTLQRVFDPGLALRPQGAGDQGHVRFQVDRSGLVALGGGLLLWVSWGDDRNSHWVFPFPEAITWGLT